MKNLILSALIICFSAVTFAQVNFTRQVIDSTTIIGPYDILEIDNIIIKKAIKLK